MRGKERRERGGCGIGGRRGGGNEYEWDMQGLMRGTDEWGVCEGRVRDCGCGCELIGMYV